MARLLIAAAAIGALCLAGACARQTDEAGALWLEYARDPDHHLNIPNVAFAGYRQGDAPGFASPRATVDVRTLGAKGDGVSDDTAAFEAALGKPPGEGGMVVLVPSGRYRVSGLLRLRHRGIVVRGAGRARTEIVFTRPLRDVVGPIDDGRGRSQWSWSGGLVWIGPEDTFDAAGHVVGSDSAVLQQWEYWRPGMTLARVSAAAAAGDRTIEVDDGARLVAGATVLATWSNTPDYSLLSHVGGHKRMAFFDWPSAGWLQPAVYPEWQWPVRIERVDGRRVTLAQPLRLDARPEWRITLRELGGHVAEAGVEHLTLVLDAPATHTHLKGAGWNGVYVNRAHDCWVSDVEVRGAENGVILAAAKNVTVADVAVTGSQESHHPFACRVGSHDNLFERFSIDGPARVRHGINTEFLSSGNVWRAGRMRRGTFDSHRALSFDSVRTDIELTNDEGSVSGGADPAGPFLGKRVVHWNVRVRGSDRDDPGLYVNQPTCLPLGALVGIQAPLSEAPCPAMPPGKRKGCIVAAAGRMPVPQDLFLAELDLRRRGH